MDRVQRIHITDTSKRAFFYVIPYRISEVKIMYTRTGRPIPLHTKGSNVPNALLSLLANDWGQYMDDQIPLELRIQEDFTPGKKELIKKFFDVFARAHNLELVYAGRE